MENRHINLKDIIKSQIKLTNYGKFRSKIKYGKDNKERSITHKERAKSHLINDVMMKTKQMMTELGDEAKMEMTMI